MKNLNATIVKKNKRPIKILQFGEGNFLRAFIEWIVQKTNETTNFNGNIAVVQPLPNGRVKELEKQDGLYTLYLEGFANDQVVKTHSVIDVIDDYIDPYSEYDKYLNYAKSEDLSIIISNTTEAGIVLDESDLNDTTCPKSFPAKLLKLLYERFLHFKGANDKGLIIMPCELIDYNGDELKKILTKLCQLKKYDEKFVAWLHNANTFCNTLVDRIVPGYPANEIDNITKELGYVDHSIVKGEIFHLWVVQCDKKVSAVFPADLAGLNVLYVDDVTPYKQQKVHILNGAHTALTPISYLAGIDTVKEAIEDSKIGKLIQDTIFDEIIPTLNLPMERLTDFANSTLERFKNPFIRHEVLSIALNSTTKYKTRILPTVLKFIDKQNKIPKRLLFALAAMIVFYRGERDGETIPVSDNKEFLEMYKSQWQKYDGSKESVNEIVTYILSLKSHWELDLNSLSGVNEFITDEVYNILQKGMTKTLEELEIKI